MKFKNTKILIRVYQKLDHCSKSETLQMSASKENYTENKTTLLFNPLKKKKPILELGNYPMLGI